MAVRVTVNMSDEANALLKRTAEAEGVTFTEALRRAVGVYATVADMERRGGRMLVEIDGSVQEVFWIA